jgi:phosphotriesterase-related protein
VFIRTVTGDIAPEKLGFAHCHEHLYTGRIRGVRIAKRIILDSYRKSLEEARMFYRCGGRCLVDAQPFGAGRDAVSLRNISRETGLHIVASTGFHKTSFYPHNPWVQNAGLKEITDLLVSEITEGMYEYHASDPFKAKSDIRAGIIKLATGDRGLTPLYEKIFSAAAEAHRITGAPIMTHTELSSFGYDQVQFLTRGGVHPEHVLISHMDRVIDVENNARLAEEGVFLQYDTIARYKYHSDEDELRLIEEMAHRGFGNQILLGLDTTRERMTAYGGNIGLDYIKTTFLPMLERAGIDGEQVQHFMINNPRRALCFAEKGSGVWD